MVKLLDCTIRDGGIVNNFDFSINFFEETLKVVDKSNIDIFEVGYIHLDKYINSNDGLWKNVPINTIKKIKEKIKPKCIFSVCADYGKFNLSQLKNNKESGIDLIRIAGFYKDIDNIINLIPEIKEMGYNISLNLMASSHQKDNDFEEIVNKLNKLNINLKPDYFYIADSFGAFFPNDIKRIFNIIKKIENIKLGYHGHNNMQMAFANTLEAINNGAHIVDGTLYGMGKCAGNLPIEKLVAYLKYKLNYNYDERPLLDFINKNMKDIINKYEWGYHLKYMITGILNATPRYGQRILENSNEINDISKKLVSLEMKDRKTYK